MLKDGGPCSAFYPSIIIIIAKNLVLAGVKSVTLYDPERVKISDLSSQFFLKETDIGRLRSESCAPHLAELNQYVPVTCLEGELRNELLTQFKVVVVTELPLKKQLEINDFCHANGIHFISTEVRGLFGYVLSFFFFPLF